MYNNEQNTVFCGSSDGKICLIDLNKGCIKKEIKPFDGKHSIFSISTDNSGNLLAIGMDHSVFLYFIMKRI